MLSTPYLKPLLWSLIVLACVERKNPPTQNTPKVTSTQGDVNPSDTRQSAETFAIQDLLLLPEHAKIRVQPNVTLTPSPLVQGHFSPSISLQHERSDYSQVMRCPHTNRFVTSDGSKDLHQPGTKATLAEKRDAWKNSLDQLSGCELISEKQAGEIFADEIAPKGTFYYVINPCISAERAILGEEGCSYRILFTHNIEVLQSVSEKMKTKHQKLALAERELHTVLIRARVLSNRIAKALEACEAAVAQDQTFLQFSKGITQLATFFASGALGSVLLSGLGTINGAVMGASLGSQLATQLWVFPDIAKFPDTIQNECIQPYVAETTAATRERLDSSEKTRDSATGGRNSSKIAGEYEDTYQVQNLVSAFDAIVKPGGALSKASENVKAQLAELHQLDSCVRDWNSARAQARNLDISQPPPASSDSEELNEWLQQFSAGLGLTNTTQIAEKNPEVQEGCTLTE
ncbi:MAG: hypothetical protein OXT67_11855 [Zetaproteobacteria bacterium]|nr:hypothetical protein [Zetaproteobacteria bacterium]